MERVPHKSFFSWYEGGNNQDCFVHYEAIKKEYNSIHGSNRKFKEFFEKYLSQADKSFLVENIQKFDNRSQAFEKLQSIGQISNFLYDLRSGFVHSADMFAFCPPGVSLTAHLHKNTPYKLTCSVEDIMRIFERGFVNYWQEKAST